MREAIALTQIDANPDPSFGFDPLSLAQTLDDKPAEANPKPAPKPNPAAAMTEKRLNDIMAVLKKIKALL